MKYRLILTALCLMCLRSTGAEYPTLTGRLSEVRIIEIARLRPDHLKGKEPAQAGLVFVFRVDRLPGHPGSFTLSELRDFKITGTNYRKPENGDRATLVEPNTAVESWTNYVSAYRPDLRAYKSIRDDGDCVLMIVEIYGPRLPAKGNCTVTIDVGWGKETEKFTHSFRLEDLKGAVTQLKQ